jgi:transcriptional regulator with XRE-family HTH domain
MQNPLAVIRKEKGLTVSEMALLNGVSSMTIQRLEHGNLQSVTQGVLDTLEKWGYNKAQVASDYEEWKIYRLSSLQEKLGI